MIKKIVSLVALCFLFTAQAMSYSLYYGTQYNLSQKTDKALVKDTILAKHSLSKNLRSGKKYVDQIDAFVEKIADNQAKLEKVISKLSEKRDQIDMGYNTLSKQEENLLLVIDYILYKSQYALNELENAQEDALLQMITEPEISEADMKKAQEAILDGQKIFQNQLEDAKEQAENIWKKYSQVTQEGDFEMDFALNYDEIGEITSQIFINDYEAKTSGFDTSVKGKLDALIEASLKGEEDIRFEAEAFFDFISVDGNLYALIDNLNIETNKKEEFKDLIDGMKIIAEEQKYIRFSDASTQAVIEVFEDLNIDEAFTQILSSFDAPLFTPYKKEGNMYHLVPSKDFCDSVKQIADVFDPFHGLECSEGQYEELVQDFLENFIVTLETVNGVHTIQISPVDQGTDFVANFSYTKSMLKSIDITAAYPFMGTDFMISYTPNNFQMESNVEQLFTSNLSIKNGQIDGKMEVPSMNYLVTLEGEYKEDYLQLDMDFSFDNPYYAFYQSYDPETTIPQSFEGVFDILLDNRRGRYNTQLDFYVGDGEEKILELSIKDAGKNTFQDVQIEAPEDYILPEELESQGFEFIDPSDDLFGI